MIATRLAALVRQFSLEVVSIAGAIATVALLRGHDLRMDLAAVQFTLLPMFPTLPKILAVGLGLHLLVALVRRERIRDFLSGVLTLQSGSSWLRVCLSFMLVTFAYAWLKVCVPLLNERLWDAALWRLDRWLHFGVSPNVFAIELLRGTVLLPALDLWYSAWLLTVFVAWSFAAIDRDLRARRHFMLASAALSLTGAWLYLAMPAAGPCYAFPEILSGVASEVSRAVEGQAALAGNYAKMVAGRDGSLRQFNPFLGVAAMPSLHVGGHFLFALWANRWAQWAYGPLLLATALTFLGSLVTGWHYAVDGYVGMAIAWLAVRVADRLESPPVVAAASVAQNPSGSDIRS